MRNVKLWLKLDHCYDDMLRMVISLEKSYRGIPEAMVASELIYRAAEKVKRLSHEVFIRDVPPELLPSEETNNNMAERLLQIIPDPKLLQRIAYTMSRDGYGDNDCATFWFKDQSTLIMDGSSAVALDSDNKITMEVNS